MQSLLVQGARCIHLFISILMYIANKAVAHLYAFGESYFLVSC